MRCKHCGGEVDAGWAFCPSCSQKVEAVCPNSGCGKPLPRGAGFCPECGYRLNGAPSNTPHVVKPQSPPHETHHDTVNRQPPFQDRGAPATGQPRMVIEDSIVMSKTDASFSIPGAGSGGVTIIKDSMVRTDITQNIIMGGQRYKLNLFADGNRSMFPAYLAQREGEEGGVFVAKSLEHFPCANELNADIRRLHLDTFPEGITRFLRCELIGDKTYLLRQYSPGKALVDVRMQQGDLSVHDTALMLMRVVELLTKVSHPHGGLGPGNVFMSRGGRLGLADWGMDVLRENIAQHEESLAPRIDQERRRNIYLSVRGDVIPPSERDAYSLAVIGCEILGADVRRLPESLKELEAKPGYREAMPLSRDLVRLLEDTVARKVRHVLAFRSRLNDVLS